ncbi:MAG: histidine phosphatase family protein [Nitrospirota bacterium]
MNLILVRHGEIFSNIKKIYAGKSQESLTPEGICQAEEVAERLASLKIDTIYTSPIQRAVQTAEIISAKLGKDIISDNAFREMEMGPWEGLSESDVARLYPEEMNIWLTRPAELSLPGRETLKELQERVLNGIKIKEVTVNRVLIVTHVAVIRVILLWHAGKNLNLYKTINVPNAAVFNIDITPDRFQKT